MDSLVGRGDGKKCKCDKKSCECTDEGMVFRCVMCLIVLLLIWCLYSLSCKLQKLDGMRAGRGYSAGSNIMYADRSNRYGFNVGDDGRVGSVDRVLTKGAAQPRTEGMDGGHLQDALLTAAELRGGRSINSGELYKQLVSGN